MRIPQKDLIGLLADRVFDADIGPTDSRGWTAAHAILTDPDPLTPLPTPSLVIEAEEPEPIPGTQTQQLTLQRDANTPLTVTWFLAEDESGSKPPRVEGDLDDVVESLCTWFDPKTPGADRATTRADIMAILRSQEYPRPLVGGIGEILELPECDQSQPVDVLAVRAKPSLPRLVAHVIGPARILPVPDRPGWTIMAPLVDRASIDTGGREVRPDDSASESSSDSKRPADAEELTYSAAYSLRRSDVIVTLWRSGPACGWELWTRRELRASGSWNTGWRDLYSADNSAATFRALSTCLGEPTDPSLARALLRSRERRGDPIAEFVQLFHLPSELLLALDEPESFSDRAELVDRTSVPAAVRAAMAPELPITRAGHIAARVWTAVVAVFAAGALAALVVGITVLFDLGEPGEDPVTTNDRLWAGIVALLAATTIGYFVYRLRARSRLKRQAAQTTSP